MIAAWYFKSKSIVKAHVVTTHFWGFRIIKVTFLCLWYRINFFHNSCINPYLMIIKLIYINQTVIAKTDCHWWYSNHCCISSIKGRKQIWLAFVKLPNSEFFQPEVDCLGHTISARHKHQTIIRSTVQRMEHARLQRVPFRYEPSSAWILFYSRIVSQFSNRLSIRRSDGR